MHSGCYLLLRPFFSSILVIKKRVGFGLAQNIYAVIGLLFIAYALIIYPLIGTYLGHGYPRLPTFGLPCPTTIFTFGIFLMADKKFPLSLLVIPLIWSIIGFFAALSLGITEDYMLLVAGVTGTALIVMKNRKNGTSPDFPERQTESGMDHHHYRGAQPRRAASALALIFRALNP